MEKISVIVPCYNNEQYLSRCINSILSQSYENIELIIINDGSTDGTNEICSFYKKKDNRVIVINKENEGVSLARNVGLDISSGDYISFVDSDDYIEYNMLEVMYNNLKKEDADVSEIDFKLIDNKKFKKKKKKSFYKVYEKDDIIKTMSSSSDIENILCTKLYKKSVISKVRLLKDMKIGEDLIFNYTVLKNCNKLVVDTRNAYYNYVINESSAMNSSSIENYISYIDYLENYFSKYDFKFAGYVNAKLIREKIKVLKRLLTYKNNNFDCYKYKYESDIKKYSFLNAVKYLSKKNVILFYIMRFFPKLYVKLYDLLQKQ